MLADHNRDHNSFLSVILDRSVGLSAGIQSAGESMPKTLGSNTASSKGRQLVSFRFDITSLLPVHQN